MIYIKEKSEKRTELKRYIIYLIIAVVLSVFDIVILDFVAAWGVTPDLLLILCVWITLREGQFQGMIAAFLCGLLFDIISFEVIGTNALAKTVAAMIAGWFYNENKISMNLESYRFLIIIFICSIFHNMLYYFLYMKFSEISFFSFFVKYGIGTSIYTTIFAIFPMLLKIPKKRLIR